LSNAYCWIGLKIDENEAFKSSWCHRIKSQKLKHDVYGLGLWIKERNQDFVASGLHNAQEKIQLF
jgi:hypothetical protein